MYKRVMVNAAACFTLILFTSPAIAIDDGHDLLEYVEAWKIYSRAIAEGDENGIADTETAVKAFSLGNFIKGVKFGVYVRAALTQCDRCSNPGIAASTGEDNAAAVHRFVSHGSVYGHWGLTPQEFLDFEAAIIVYGALEAASMLCGNEGDDE